MTETRLLDAGYFYTTFKNPHFAMNLVQLSTRKTSGDQRKEILKAMEEIGNFQPEVILLYTSKEIGELMLQQVTIGQVFTVPS